MIDETHCISSKLSYAWQRMLRHVAVGCVLFSLSCNSLWNPFLEFRACQHGCSESIKSHNEDMQPPSEDMQLQVPFMLAFQSSAMINVLAPTSVLAGDFNGDQKPDLVVVSADDASVNVLLGNGMGGFSAPTQIPIGGQPHGGMLGDFNGDQKTDLAVTTGTMISVLLGNGTGGFGTPTNFPGGSNYGRLAVGDFNGDTKTDLVRLDHILEIPPIGA